MARTDGARNPVGPVAAGVIQLHERKQLFCGKVRRHEVKHIQIEDAGAVTGGPLARFFDSSAFGSDETVG